VKCAALLIWLLIPVAQIHAQTQADMNAQARAEFKQADAELNKTYQAVLAKLPAAEKQKLKGAERAWIASRDAEAARAAKKAEGGSMAPTLRYETMTDLTRKRITELKAMIDKGRASESPTEAPESETKEASSVSQAKPSRISPDNKWEYKCIEYADGAECFPQIVKAGTNEVVVDLQEDLSVSGSESKDDEIVWASDSKRFAFNYSPLHPHHTVSVTVAFYQLRDDKWLALQSPVEESENTQLVELAKRYLAKDFNPRPCAPDVDILKLHNWTDANTAILYAPCYARTSDGPKLQAGFLFTIKFDEAGNWKIVNTHRMSKKELKAEDRPDWYSPSS